MAAAGGATEEEREGAGVEGRERERDASSVMRRALSSCSKRRLRSAGSKWCEGGGRRGGWWLWPWLDMVRDRRGGRVDSASRVGLEGAGAQPSGRGCEGEKRVDRSRLDMFEEECDRGTIG